MIGHSRSLHMFASIALVVVACVGLASCGGGGSRSVAGSAGDEMVILPPPPPAGAPDLEVGTPSVDDASPETGGSFTLSATVSNDGDGGATATTLRYYRSTDATITTSDTEVGTDAVGALAASATSSASVDLTAPSTAGTYYYGACVDAVTDESDTTNNCSASVQVTVSEPPAQTAPELSVGTPTVDDASPETGGSFTLSATVSNDGDGGATATTLRYYRSTDATITTSDTEVGTDAVGALAASATSSASVDLTAPSTAGTYYYGACVDAVTDESDTTDNCSASVQVTVSEPPAQTAPELSVGTPTVDDASPETGGSFTLSATVSNDGDGAAPATTLRYYRSTDATITTSDTEVGTDAVKALAVAGASAQSIDLTAPSTAGPYYYGACVDAVTDESDTTNNCSASVQVTVSEPPAQTAPELSVGTPTVDDASPETGGSFTLSATVSNDGDGGATATTLRYYRSTDATITTSDTEVGTDAVGALAASATSSASVDLTAPSTAGTYYYGACVDAVTDESDTTDNCSASVQVTVSEPPAQTAPELSVGTPTVDDASPETGGSFTLSATVSNDGDGAAPATTLRYYRSTDATITTSDTEVGTDAVKALAVAGASAQSIDLTAPSTAGPYYYGACVDAVTDESDTTNNCSASVQVNVSEPQHPDLTVGSPSVDDASPETGGSFALSATVSNDGDAEAPATTLHWYRSTDATITTSDTEVGTDAVGALAASATSSASVDLAAPSTAGPYYYGACVDAVADESDTTNNCSASVQVNVSEPQASPDLSVVSPTVSNNAPVTGDDFELSTTVTNQGDRESVATTMRFYRSSDPTITTEDVPVGTMPVEPLSEVGSRSETVLLTAPVEPGTYYYGACVDPVPAEAKTTNNCSPGVEVTVLRTAPQQSGQPNLEVGTPTVDDASPDTSAPFTLSATVSNTGDGEAPATTLRYYRSTDATITTSDTEVGTDAVGVLAATGTSARSILLRASTTTGPYYYGACVDAVTDESDTTDNCSSSVQVNVVARKRPDLVVGSPNVSNNAPGSGGNFDLSATVTNRGDGAATSTLRYYRSTDATISTSDTEVGTDDVGILSASETSAESISLRAPLAAGTYYYGACIDIVAGESNRTNNCSTAVAVTVSPTTPPIAGPDLEVGTPTADDTSPETSARFMLSLRVNNTGDRASVATTLRWYRSTDAAISATDTAVGTDSVRLLSSRDWSKESITLMAPSTAGTYYYGACVDAVTDESDTTDNCSASVRIDVVEPTTRPDLVAGSPKVDDATPEKGTTITLSATVSNTGDRASAATMLHFYRSTNQSIATTDTSVGSVAVGAIAAGGNSGALSISLSAPLAAGTYYYGACVTAVAGESDTTDNCTQSVAVTIAGPPPDLVVLAPDLGEVQEDGTFWLLVTVHNQGGGGAAATTLRYYRSADSTITTSDTQVGTDSVGTRPPLTNYGGTIKLTAPTTPGTYYYGACVDAVPGESDTSNNCSTSASLVVN